jgi:calpain-15
MSALSSLAEMPEHVEKLFITQAYNEEGVYRLRICNNGAWVEVTVDDYFPCMENGGPIFSRSNGNELWVLLIEKAYAKIHGNYYNLRDGYVYEGMKDLTGCPTECLEFDNEAVKTSI